MLKHSDGVDLNLVNSGNHDNERKNVLMEVNSKYLGYTHYALEVGSAEDAKAFLESIGLTLVPWDRRAGLEVCVGGAWQLWDRRIQRRLGSACERSC